MLLFEIYKSFFLFIRKKLILSVLLIPVFIIFLSCTSSYNFYREQEVEIIKLPRIIEYIPLLIDEQTHFTVYEDGKPVIMTSNDLGKEYFSKTGFYYNSNYIGSLLVLREKGDSNLLQLISKIELETYVAGVISAEMGKKFHPEALKAQAIASRTYVVEKISNNPDFIISNSTNHQVFKYNEISYFLQFAQATQSQILTYNNAIIQAFYHASSGGILTVPELEWGGTGLPYYHIKKDPYSVNTVEWNYSLSKTQIADMIHAWGLTAQKEQIYQISLVKRVQDSRIDKINIILGNGKNISIKGKDFRTKVGTTLIKSLLFSVEKKNDTFIFKGSGYGHGIGLSQWGAQTMAEQGKNYREILGFYYDLCQVGIMASE